MGPASIAVPVAWSDFDCGGGSQNRLPAIGRIVVRERGEDGVGQSTLGVNEPCRGMLVSARR